MGEQFCLKWNNHQSTIISLFDTLLETGKHVDCSLTAEGKVLKAHKVVLSACSPYLEELLNQHPDKYPILVFSDIKFGDLKAMLDYMYRGEVNVLQEQLSGFLKAAETLQIKGLTDQGGGGGDTGGGDNGPGSKRKSVVSAEPPTPKRRRARKPSQESDNSHIESGNSCDAPPLVTKAETETSRLPPVTPTPPVHTAPKLEPPEMIQPKTEYIEEMNNDGQVEDLTLDDEDDDDSYMAKPGTSHGDNSMGGNDSNWHFDTSNPEVFLGAQDGSNQSNSQVVRRWKVKPIGKRLEYNCLSCCFVGETKESIKLHFKLRHSKSSKEYSGVRVQQDDVLLVCPHCRYTAKHEKYLIGHILALHSPAQVFNCEFCDFKGRSSNEIRAHLYQHHYQNCKQTMSVVE